MCEKVPGRRGNARKGRGWGKSRGEGGGGEIILGVSRDGIHSPHGVSMAATALRTSYASKMMAATSSSFLLA